MLENSSFYSNVELSNIGFKSLGENVFISKKASIYNPEQITIANNVRIDDFCILSGVIILGSYIHISAYTALYGGAEGIFIDDFSGISAHTTIYAISDDFSGNYMVGAMINDEYRNVIKGAVCISKYVQIGVNCVILPDVLIEEGVAVGSMSLINKGLESWSIYAGIPCHFIKKRNKKLLSLKDQFLKNS